MKFTVLLLYIFVLSLYLLPLSLSECANGCSGHGRCMLYDVCWCYRNWQGILNIIFIETN